MIYGSPSGSLAAVAPSTSHTHRFRQVSRAWGRAASEPAAVGERRRSRRPPEVLPEIERVTDAYQRCHSRDGPVAGLEEAEAAGDEHTLGDGSLRRRRPRFCHEAPRESARAHRRMPRERVHREAVGQVLQRPASRAARPTRGARGRGARRRATAARRRAPRSRGGSAWPAPARRGPACRGAPRGARAAVTCPTRVRAVIA